MIYPRTFPAFEPMTPMPPAGYSGKIIHPEGKTIVGQRRKNRQILQAAAGSALEAMAAGG
jgi:hypothetical protein